jgi:hypothetical protein
MRAEAPLHRLDAVKDFGRVLGFQLQHALQLGAGEERRLSPRRAARLEPLLVAFELRDDLGQIVLPPASVIVLTAEPGSSNVSVAMPSASIA